MEKDVARPGIPRGRKNRVPATARHRPRADDPAGRVHLGEEADFATAGAADFGPDRTGRIRRERERAMLVAQVFCGRGRAAGNSTLFRMSR